MSDYTIKDRRRRAAKMRGDKKIYPYPYYKIHQSGKYSNLRNRFLGYKVWKVCKV